MIYNLTDTTALSSWVSEKEIQMRKSKKWTWKNPQNQFWFLSSFLCSDETKKENLTDENFAASIKDSKSQ